MTIRTTYRVEGRTSGRFVRKAIGQSWYKWCEQSADDPRYDVAQGTCDAEDLPPQIKKTCDDLEGEAFYACIWPFDTPRTANKKTRRSGL